MTDASRAVGPALWLVLLGIASVQFGAALAKTLFDDVGPGGAVMLRIVFAALALALIFRPRLRGHAWADWRLAVAFGLTLAAMNSSFYAALDRIPLGIAVTLEFVGPLGVAVLGSRRPRDVLWVLLAAAGIVLLAAPGGAGLDALGVALALLAGAFWAAYILLSARTGRAFPGGGGLALAMAVAALAVLPLGIADGGAGLLDPGVLALGAAVAALSAAIPYTAELEALRRLPEAVFGVLMSLEPAAGALAGFLVLSQGLSPREAAGIALVVAASAGAAAGARSPPARDA